MVNKLVLEVDGRWSGYAACNVGVNGSDPFGGACPTGTYCCDCATDHFPPKKVACNLTVGYENVFEKFGQFMVSGPVPRSPRTEAPDSRSAPSEPPPAVCRHPSPR